MKRAILFSILAAVASTTLHAATIRGKVVYPNGAAYAGVTAVAIDASQRKTTTAYTDRAGWFYIHNVRPGNYTVTVQTPQAKRNVAVTVTAAEYADVAPLRMR